MIELSSSQIMLIIIIPLLVGLLTNFIWESLGRKYIGITGNFLLKFMSFGKTTIIDSIYKDIARKNIHKPIAVITFLMMLTSIMLLGYASGDVKNKFLNQRHEFRQESNNVPTKELADKISKLQNEINENEKELAIEAFFASLLFSIYAAYSHIRNSYVVSGVLHFEQCLSIIRPFITEQDYHIFNSRFSQIKNSLDYKNILNEIYDLCHENNSITPDFLLL